LDSIRDLSNQYHLHLPVDQNKDKKVEKSKQKALSKSFRKSLDHATETKEFQRIDLSPQEVEEVLEELLDSVSDAGDRLYRDPSQNLMMAYKKAIQDFIRVVVSSAYDVYQREGSLKKDFKRNKYTQIELINSRLDKLASSILQGQKSSLNILERVEELKGLLVDLKK